MLGNHVLSAVVVSKMRFASSTIAKQTFSKLLEVSQGSETFWSCVATIVRDLKVSWTLPVILKRCFGGGFCC